MTEHECSGKEMSSCFKNAVVGFLPWGEVVHIELYRSDCPEAVGIKLNEFLTIEPRSPFRCVKDHAVACVLALHSSNVCCV